MIRLYHNLISYAMPMQVRILQIRILARSDKYPAFVLLDLSRSSATRVAKRVGPQGRNAHLDPCIFVPRIHVETDLPDSDKVDSSEPDIGCRGVSLRDVASGSEIALESVRNEDSRDDDDCRKDLSSSIHHLGSNV